MSNPTLIKRHKCFDGWVEYYSHASKATRTDMRFAVYLPPQAAQRKVPVLYYLSGLTCTEETFMIKSGAQRYAAEHGIMLVAPDTSPRGAGIEGESESWDFGLAAGFYVNATEPKWAKHYNMFDYVVDELPILIDGHFPANPARRSIMGHSMGGHGALVMALRHPERFQSVSAVAPICAPSQCPWGEKAFRGYLGEDRSAWLAYDATHLVSLSEAHLPILIDQGAADEFLETQLKPELLRQTCEHSGYPLELRLRPGYDHGYFFVQSVIGEHLAYHAGFLNPAGS
jgi:S-formylglutathione hydrolase